MPFAYGALTRSGRPSQTVPLDMPRAPGLCPRRAPATPQARRPAVWAPPRSLAATGGISFDFFSCRYLDGSLPCVSPRAAYVFGRAARGIAPRGLLHSGTRGSRDVGSSPRLFAACRALPRLAAPRHPPRTHIRLTISSFPPSRSIVKNPSTGGRGVRTPDPRLAKPMP